MRLRFVRRREVADLLAFATAVFTFIALMRVLGEPARPRVLFEALFVGMVVHILVAGRRERLRRKAAEQTAAGSRAAGTLDGAAQ